MIQMLAKFVLVQDASCVGHLGPLKQLVAKQPRLVIATLLFLTTSSNFLSMSLAPNEGRLAGIEAKIFSVTLLKMGVIKSG